MGASLGSEDGESRSPLNTANISREKCCIHRNITSSFLELGPYNQRRYTGDFRIEDKDKRLVILDDIQGVEIPQEKAVEVNFIQSRDATKAVVQFHNPIQAGKRVALRLALDLQDYATFDNSSPSIDIWLAFLSFFVI